MLGIVITAYNRAQPLQELLDSLNKVRIPEGRNIPLVISIDNNGTPDVNNIAKKFVWNHGEKSVIIHKEKLGLVKHFIWAGDQTELFEHVIFLEDDLLVSPEMLNYADQIIDFYENDDDVAGASFYNPTLNEFTGTRFYQLEDGYDNFFMQQPYWGNIWFKKKWRLFKKYLETYEFNVGLLPQRIANWKASFKKLFIQYLIENNRYIVTSRRSIATNNGCEGLHNVEALYMYQVNLLLRQEKFTFSHVKDSLSVYDAFIEISPAILKRLNPLLIKYDFDVDLNGLRTTYNSKYVLTTKPVDDSVIRFTSTMKPTELGVVMNILGDNNISLAETSNLVQSSKYYGLRQWKDINKNYHFNLNKYVIEAFVMRCFCGIRNIFKYRLLK